MPRILHYFHLNETKNAKSAFKNTLESLDFLLWFLNADIFLFILGNPLDWKELIELKNSREIWYNFNGHELMKEKQ